jgi:uncharacterized protein YcfJ
MKRIAATALALALTAAAGSAAFAAQDYGRYDNRAAYDNRAMQYDNRYARNYSGTDVAQVVRAVPMGDPYASYQRQECWNEQVNGYQPGYYRDPNGQLYYRGTDSNANGTIIGGLIGGALGNQAGKGDGRKAATIGGAVIGALIGNSVDRNHGPSAGAPTARNGEYQYQTTGGQVTRCRTVTDYDTSNRFTGYDVTYRYAGRTYKAVTAYRPGPTIRVAVDVRPLDQGGVATRY